MAKNQNDKQKAHNDAQRLGSRSNLVDKIAQQIERPFRSEHYKKGLEHGYKNPKK